MIANNDTSQIAEARPGIGHEPVAAFLQQQITTRKTPGLYYAFFDAAQIRYTFAGGKADLQNNTPVDDQTVFYGFSMTKTFTATAVMQLSEQGKLHLDDPVIKYLPDFGCGDNIHIRHLLAHSAGLPNPLPMRWIHRAEEHAGFEEQRFFESIFQKITRIRSAPNEKFAYSNPGYLLLGRVIEKASGLPYRRYIEQHILEPLGVQNRLGFERQQHWNIATGYHKTFSVGNLLLGILLDKKRFMGESTEGWKSFLPFYINGSAYGGLLGTPGAYITFAQHLLKNESRLLSQAGRQEMWRENTLLNGKSAGMSLGWFKGNLDGRAYACHAGGGGGFYCEIRVYPESGLGSVVFMNRSGFSDERFLDKADAILLADDAG